MPIEPLEADEVPSGRPGGVPTADDWEEKPKAKTYGPGMKKLHGQLTDLYVNIGAMVVTPLDRLAGTLLVAQSSELADTWIDLAETNPSVKRSLQKLVEVGGWGGVLAAHGMILLPVLANRGALPDSVASGTAMMTMVAHPETAKLFTHERFSKGTDNGNGSIA